MTGQDVEGGPFFLPKREGADNMNFGDALKLVRRGWLITRTGWNGKNMFVFLGFPRVSVVMKSQSSLTDTVDAWEAFNCKYDSPVLCMKTAQETIVVGWLASQTDLLNDDWIEYVDPAKPDLE